MPMKRVIPVFALLLVAALAEAVPPPRLAKRPLPVPLPNIVLAKQLNARFIIPPKWDAGHGEHPFQKPAAGDY